MTITTITQAEVVQLLPPGFNPGVLDHPGVRGVVIDAGKLHTFGPMCKLRDWSTLQGSPGPLLVWNKPHLSRTDLAIELFKASTGSMYACAKLVGVNQSAVSRKLRHPGVVCPCCGRQSSH